MTNLEFRNKFDLFYNNIMSNQAPGLDDYEKSEYLTRAQEQLVLSYYTGNNPTNISFEKTEEARRYLDSLVKTVRLYSQSYNGELLSQTSQVFTLPSNLWFITYESAVIDDINAPCIDNREVTVVPVTQDEYYRTKENPFKGSNMRRVLRLDLGNNKIELASKYFVSSYLVRYIERLSPIILTDLPDGVTIGGISTETPCALNESLHKAILELAVLLASQDFKE